MKNKTFAPLEGDGRVTLPAGIIGTLSNDDDDNNNNVKKQLVLWAKQQLCTCITLFSTFLWRPLHDYDVKPPNATFYGGRGHTTTKFPFSIWTWIKLKNLTPGKVVYIWGIERFKIDAVKFERTQIHFLVMFSLPLSLLKVPNTLTRPARGNSVTVRYSEHSRALFSRAKG